jgi:hypothetical protein
MVRLFDLFQECFHFGLLTFGVALTNAPIVRQLLFSNNSRRLKIRLNLHARPKQPERMHLLHGLGVQLRPILFGLGLICVWVP